MGRCARALISFTGGTRGRACGRCVLLSIPSSPPPQSSDALGGFKRAPDWWGLSDSDGFQNSTSFGRRTWSVCVGLEVSQFTARHVSGFLLLARLLVQTWTPSWTTEAPAAAATGSCASGWSSRWTAGSTRVWCGRTTRRASSGSRGNTRGNRTTTGTRTPRCSRWRTEDGEEPCVKTRRTGHCSHPEILLKPSVSPRNVQIQERLLKLLLLFLDLNVSLICGAA